MVMEPLTPERRRQQTRDTLIQAGAQVFAERGFHGASLDEVASVAGFTKGAVYSNFKGKDDLFLAVLESRYERELAALFGALDSSTGNPEDLSEFTAHIRRQFNDDEDLWSVLYQEFCLYAVRNPEARVKLAAVQRADVDVVTQFIATERKRYGIEVAEPPDHQARIVIALFRGLSNMRSVDRESVDDALLESVMGFIGRAMYPTSDQPE
jgi:AcrR family transcriptional regulator